ncbi:IS66 family transposase [Variovorax saccharolyticus]|uniref:IS66 family transposase n=1 Tax=Variovorax saccharolyticus TaxID=3053516 RepID=UPI00257561C8|nr:transposase [Variovorax sp. J31P216]MDM0030451.1 transposase [Variovorax sp. J31P216]
MRVQACTHHARRSRPWGGQAGAQMEPLFDAHSDFVLGSQVLHVNETPVSTLDQGADKTKRTHVWAYARECETHAGMRRELHPSEFPAQRSASRFSGAGGQLGGSGKTGRDHSRPSATIGTDTAGARTGLWHWRIRASADDGKSEPYRRRG